MKNEITEVANQVVKKKKSTAPQTIDLNFDTDDEKKAYNRKVLTELLEYYGSEPVKNDQDALDRTKKYFIRCAEKGVKPTVEEYAMALGVGRQSIWDYEQGKRGTVSAYIIKNAKDFIAAYDAKAVVDGKMNPVPYIFRAKNYYGMKDQQDVIVTPNTLETRSRESLIAEAEQLPDE